jgi:hypothetical protein
MHSALADVCTRVDKAFPHSYNVLLVEVRKGR